MGTVLPHLTDGLRGRIEVPLADNVRSIHGLPARLTGLARQ